MWTFNWRIGETNRFIIGARIEDQKTRYTAWIRADNAWKKLATFRTRAHGSTLNGYYSFIEDFRRDGDSVQQTRRARFANGWIKTTRDDWVPLAKARFTASNAPAQLNPVGRPLSYKYLENAIYDITYSSGELDGYWLDHPETDSVDGHTLKNVLRINGNDVLNGRYVPYSR